MEWLVIIVVVIIIVWLFGRFSSSESPNRGTVSEKWIEREGEFVQADEAFNAWTSGDFATMVQALEIPTNPIDRHFLLLSIVEKAYKERGDPSMRSLFLKHAQQHVDEFPGLVTPLKQEFDGQLPRVPTFQYLATVHTEDGRFDEAIEICECALTFDLHDGTESGFEGRIQRIQKKKIKVG